MLALGKDKSLGIATLPQPHSGRKRLGRSSPKSWEHMPPPQVQEMPSARAAAGGDSLVPTQLTGAGGNTVCKHTAVTAPGHLVLGFSTGEAGVNCCGQREF